MSINSTRALIIKYVAGLDDLRIALNWKAFWGLREVPLSMFQNSITLILARISSSGLGFLTWLLVARLYEPNEVGIASGVVSAMMLCVQLALLGVSSAIIKHFPEYEDNPPRLLNTAFSIVFTAALSIALFFLILASVFFRELSVVGTVPLYIILFLAISLFGAMNVFLDHISIAQRRGDQVLARNVLFGIVTIIAIIVSAILLDTTSSMSIIAVWALAGVSVITVGVIQLFRSTIDNSFSPEFKPTIARLLVSTGMPNYLLTLMERVPLWIIPIIVTEFVSPTANAHWYAVWGITWVVFIIPISIGQNLFAEISHHPANAGKIVRHSIRSSLGIGGIAAVIVAVMAAFVLLLLGRDYASAGANPLRILVVAVIPVTFMQVYYGVCRATGRLGEAIITGAANGLTSIGLLIIIGVQHNLLGIAITWVAIQFATGLWVLVRLRYLMKLGAPTIKVNAPRKFSENGTPASTLQHGQTD